VRPRLHEAHLGTHAPKPKPTPAAAFRTKAPLIALAAIRRRPAFNNLRAPRRPASAILITWAIARLCRGGSKGLTIPAIAPRLAAGEVLKF
jgi:hypothetical protein